MGKCIRCAQWSCYRCFSISSSSHHFQRIRMGMLCGCALHFWFPVSLPRSHWLMLLCALLMLWAQKCTRSLEWSVQISCKPYECYGFSFVCACVMHLHTYLSVGACNPHDDVSLIFRENTHTYAEWYIVAKWMHRVHQQQQQKSSTNMSVYFRSILDFRQTNADD